MKYCLIIPTYNNASTLLDVVERSLAVCADVIVVNDGSTDQTSDLLAAMDNVTVVSYTPNRGKGHALCEGFRKAKAMGFDYAITLDADGQHFPEDVPALLATLDEESEKNNGKVLVVGSRNLNAPGMPSGNTFANRFSNFWFAVQTAQRLPDTQTGFRIYPLHHLPNLNLITRRYESELELLVFSAWRNVRIVPSPVRVYYPPKEERVSHFRPFADFARISVLNTFLCIAALVYGYPSMLIRRMFKCCEDTRLRDTGHESLVKNSKLY